MPSSAPPLRVMSTLAVAGLLREMLPALDAPPELIFEPTKSLLDRIAAGERADAAILTVEAADSLVASGILRADTRREVAVSWVGLAVRAGAPRPDIATAEALRQTLLDAKSLVYSRAGASGLYFVGLMERLGLTDALAPKAIVIPAGFTGEVVARGDAELAIQQVSELMVVPGLDIVGPLPATLQTPLAFSALLFAGSSRVGEGTAFLDRLAAAATPEALARHGLEPV
ncbi:substrate-binding domain-containing protein [Muricoccus radiodurans]|uniref:substrate-binding domain-containing protein n=1 Tax=Muricoccus radiodurans TaxID=2231721 RepID=UPI003CF438B7